MREFKDNVEYWNYVENQRENCVDLTNGDSAKELAQHLFSQDYDTLDKYLTRIIVDDMDASDLFCFLIEVLLYGIDIITHNNHTIIDFDDDSIEYMNIISKYMSSMGFKVNINKDNNRTRGHCVITNHKDYSDWHVLDYAIVVDPSLDNTCNISDMEALFVNHKRDVYVVRFEIVGV